MDWRKHVWTGYVDNQSTGNQTQTVNSVKIRQSILYQVPEFLMSYSKRFAK